MLCLCLQNLAINLKLPPPAKIVMFRIIKFCNLPRSKMKTAGCKIHALTIPMAVSYTHLTLPTSDLV